MKNLLIITIILLSIMLHSCASVNVTRTDSNTVTDLSGRWNDTDSRLVAEEMISDSLSRPWINTFRTSEGRPPVVIVGTIRNRSSEHIDTLVFTKDIEREFINSGQVMVVASADEREGVRDERLYQYTEADSETRKRLGQEFGADYIMIGTISSISDQVDLRRTILYQVDIELIHIESNIKAWIGSKEIKKEIEQNALRL